MSGQVRPRQGTEICNFGAPSPLEALHWIFCFFSSIYLQFSKTSPLKSGESSENPVEKIASNPVTSVAVMVFSALIMLFEKAVNPGTTSRLTRRKCLFSFFVREKFRREHINSFVLLTGRLSLGQPDPHQSKHLMFMCLFLFLLIRVAFFWVCSFWPFDGGNLSRGGKPWETNREKDHQITRSFFFTVYVPNKPWKALRKPWKNRHHKSTIFSPLVFHRLRLLDGIAWRGQFVSFGPLGKFKVRA